MRLDRSSISAALVAASRRISYLLPRCTSVGGYGLEAVRQRCRRSFERWGHCEIPYPAGDIRRAVWVDEVQAIVSERLATVFQDPAAVIRLSAGGDGEPIPFPIPPAPVPEEEQDGEPEELPAAAKLINRERENVIA